MRLGSAWRLGPGAVATSGLIGLRYRIALGTRPLGHLHLAVRAVGHGRRPQVALAALGASLAGDALLIRRLADPRYVPGTPHRLMEAADAALWAGIEQAPTTMAGAMTIDAQGSAMEAWFRAAAGQRAVPPVARERCWAVERLDVRVRAAVTMAAPILLPFAAGAVVRRVLGLRANPTDLVWSVGMAASAFAAARARDRSQRRAREDWSALVRDRIDFEAEAARAELTTASSPAHDFKKTLYVLGFAGSAEALEAARVHSDRPGRVLADARHGQPLRLAAGAVPVAPAVMGRTWLDPSQVEHVRAFVDAALAEGENRPIDGAAVVLRVSSSTAASLCLELLGQRLELRIEPPTFRARLDPTATMFGLSALLRLSDLLPEFRTLPAPAVLATAGLDLVATSRFARRPPSDEEAGLVIGLVAASACIGFSAAASRRAQVVTRGGDPHHAAISIAQGAGLVLASHWARLGQRQRWALPAVLGGFVAASGCRSRTPIVTWIESATVLAQSVLSTWRLTDLIDAEAEVLHSALLDEYRQACDQARADAVSGELDRFRAELEVARLALEDVREGLDADTVRAIEDDCAELEAWLDRAPLGRGPTL